jgi:hypothetical protein
MEREFLDIKTLVIKTGLSESTLMRLSKNEKSVFSHFVRCGRRKLWPREVCEELRQAAFAKAPPERSFSGGLL